MTTRRVRHRTRFLLGALLLAAGSSCASLEFEKTSEDAGSFTSKAYSFTFLGWDFPGPAMSIARANAADSARPNLIVEEEISAPYLGWFDWLLEIIGVRYARVSGTWGGSPLPATDEDAR